jgi:hypothetical protein
MVRNNESWDLGEPELNERGQPVVHDVATRLGCIRPPSDIPIAFAEDLEHFTELQTQFKPTCLKISAENAVNGKLPVSSSSSPSLSHRERAASTKSRHSAISKDYNQTLLGQEQQHINVKTHAPVFNQATVMGLPFAVQQNPKFEDPYNSSSSRVYFDSSTSVSLPFHPDLRTQSHVLRSTSPFSVSSTEDDIPGQPNAIDLTAQFIQALQYGTSIDHSLAPPSRNLEPSELNFADRTRDFAPCMLDYHDYDARGRIEYRGMATRTG